MRFYDWQTEFFFNPILDSHLKLAKPSFFWSISSPLPHHTPDPSTMFPEQPKPRSLPYSASSQLFPFQVFLLVLLTQCTFQNTFNGECCSPTTNIDWPATLVAEGGGREPVLWRCWCAHLQLGKVDCHQGSGALRVSAQTRWKDVTVVLEA